MRRLGGLIADRASGSLPSRATAVAAVVLALAAASPASAQYVCTSTATDLTCTNSGTAGPQATTGAPGQNATTSNTGSSGDINTDATGANATTINAGTVAGSTSTVTDTGNATTTNTGAITGAMTTTATTGNVTATNSGSVGISVFTTTHAGNAIMVNSGSIGGQLITATSTGNATTINSGAAGRITTNAGAGIAATLNTGTVALTLTTSSGPGLATSTNSGTVGGFLTTMSLNGNALAFNSGTVGALITFANGGSAAATNTGTARNGFFTQASVGSAVAINSGTSLGGLTVVTSNAASALAINTGTVIGPVTLTTFGSGNATLTNSGVISNFGGTAIQFNGGLDTLNLLPGSTIIGGIDLVGANDTVNVFAGNQNLTFNTLAGATVNGNVPFVVAGNQLVSIDPTPFGLADKTLMDFTRAVSGLLDGIGAGAAASGPLSSAFAPSVPGSVAARLDAAFAAIPALADADDQAPVFKAPGIVTADGRAIWARGFGGRRTQDADGAMLAAHTTFLGGAVGFDVLARPDLRLGLFAGGGESRLALAGNSGSTNTDTAFGGMYGRWSFVSFGRPSFLDVALHGGGSTNAASRTINDNTLASGIEIATARYASSYVSPEVAYGLVIPLWAQYTLTPSLRLRYVAGFFGGYSETGTTAPLAVASRTTQDMEERAELKLRRAVPVGPDLLLTSVHLGAIGVERIGDRTIDTVLLGLDLPFVTPGRNDVAGIVGGGGFEWRTREGIALFGAAEAIGFSDQSTVWSARGGVRVAF
ncbi:MAG TPA: autotransporter domain-containing protein [Xanthobacteraceae bacterium]|nr:autotransporter domain-containing protein [Xanthobacteraceae bacterium]